MKNVIIKLVCIFIFLSTVTINIYPQRIPICPEEDYPEDEYEIYDPQLSITLCLNGLGLGCDNCCITLFYFKRYVNGGDYLDFQFDYVVWEDLTDPDNPSPESCILCGRLNEEYLKMALLEKLFLRHCRGVGEYDFRGKTSYNHHVVMRSGCIAPGPNGFPIVCEIIGCCFKLFKITINSLGTAIQIQQQEPIEYYYYPYPQICTDPPPCILTCGLVAGLNTLASNPKETLADNIITDQIKCIFDDINNSLDLKVENNDQGLVQVFIYNYMGDNIKNYSFYKKDFNLSQIISLDNISSGVYFTNILINGLVKYRINFYLFN